jgi:EpsI family protein
MPVSSRKLGFPGNRWTRILSAVLLLEAAGFYGTSRREEVPAPRPLAELPSQFSAWRMVREEVIDPEMQTVLRADDVVSRLYADSARGRTASLFVAYFKSQRTGQAPHSPKNCMPGSGWAPTESGVTVIQIPGRQEPIRVNRYVVAKGDEKLLVLYWYQSRDRVIASEYAAKFYLVADAIRYNRTDTALIRVTVPLSGDEGVAARAAEEFVQSFFVSLRQFLPA